MDGLESTGRVVLKLHGKRNMAHMRHF